MRQGAFRACSALEMAGQANGLQAMAFTKLRRNIQETSEAKIVDLVQTGQFRKCGSSSASASVKTMLRGLPQTPEQQNRKTVHEVASGRLAARRDDAILHLFCPTPQAIFGFTEVVRASDLLRRGDAAPRPRCASSPDFAISATVHGVVFDFLSRGCETIGPNPTGGGRGVTDAVSGAVVLALQQARWPATSSALCPWS
jgi:hypothetical protein